MFSVSFCQLDQGLQQGWRDLEVPGGRGWQARPQIPHEVRAQGGTRPLAGEEEDVVGQDGQWPRVWSQLLHPRDGCPPCPQHTHFQGIQCPTEHFADIRRIIVCLEKRRFDSISPPKKWFPTNVSPLNAESECLPRADFPLDPVGSQPGLLRKEDWHHRDRRLGRPDRAKHRTRGPDTQCLPEDPSLGSRQVRLIKTLFKKKSGQVSLIKTLYKKRWGFLTKVLL